MKECLQNFHRTTRIILYSYTQLMPFKFILRMRNVWQLIINFLVLSEKGNFWNRLVSGQVCATVTNKRG